MAMATGTRAYMSAMVATAAMAAMAAADNAQADAPAMRLIMTLILALIALMEFGKQKTTKRT